MSSRAPRTLLGVALSGALLAGTALSASPAAAAQIPDDLYGVSRLNAGLLDRPAVRTDRRQVGLVLPAGPAHPGAVPGSLPGAAAQAAGIAAIDPIEPGDEPTPDPTGEPSPEPTVEPTGEPTEDPTPDPTGEPTEEPTDPTDTTPPTGSFVVSTASAWIGQKVILSQTALSDDVSAPDQIARTVNWGDGTSAILPAGATSATKAYAKAGRYVVSVRLTDASGNSAAAAVTRATVTVTVPGKFTFNKTALWHAESFRLTIGSVPAGTNKIVIDWGDGWISTHKGQNQQISGYYYLHKNGNLLKPGKYPVRATFTNALGTSAPFLIGQITLKRDSWRPVVKIKKPAKSVANRIASWKTVRGTATDKGAGMPGVYVFVTRVTGNAVYCYTPKKKWKRVYTQEALNNCLPLEARVKKGKWSLQIKNLKKGTLYIDAIAFDWADNASRWASVKQKITRN